ncbi:hypothetical protein FM037_03005 [Shewanella psychropiezotolerans]|uniref:Uncharacterized protein n=1 Tax=Shewanella psychropiezotolerans TaxID=2593655 RepID=A0ABX5WU30_9GAMM|nr:hypothetical protein [Shewanella psychropiezotolerans]QDO82398.1 hypothetical protein FM037_03005 [Shewanella psychropiezotolerans]
MKSATFQHLLNHYRSYKKPLGLAIECHQICPDQGYAVGVAKNNGAMECLYWQAMGNGLVNLAKGIRRTLTKAKAVHGIEGL